MAHGTQGCQSLQVARAPCGACREQQARLGATFLSFPLKEPTDIKGGKDCPPGGVSRQMEAGIYISEF